MHSFRKFPVTKSISIVSHPNRHISTSRPPREPRFVIVRATIDDHSRIFDLMHKTFYKGEPLAASIGLQPNASLDEDVHKNLIEGFTLVARCKRSGEMIGACINYVTNPWDADDMDRLACHVQCPKAKQMLHFRAFMRRTPQLFQQYQVNKIYELGCLFVKDNEKKEHIEWQLVQDSHELGAESGFPLIKAHCTNQQSAKLCEKLKMKLIREIPYNAYVDNKLKPIFTPAAPNTSVKVYIDDNPKQTAASLKDQTSKENK